MFAALTFLSLFCLIGTQHLVLAMPLTPPNAPTEFVNQPCVQLNSINVLDQPFPPTYESAAILLTCSSEQGGVITHFSGQRSSVTSNVLCNNTPLISYNEDADRITMPVMGKPSVCQNGLCVFYDSIGNQVLVSALLAQSEIGALGSDASAQIPFLRTTLLFAFDGLQQTFASRMLAAFMQNVSGEIDLRAMAFLGTSASTCSFPVAPCFCQN